MDIEKQKRMKKQIFALSKLHLHESCFVKKINCQRPERIRLFELGLISGAKITVKKRAPFSFPVTIEVCGYELCLGKKECDEIFVEASR